MNIKWENLGVLGVARTGWREREKDLRKKGFVWYRGLEETNGGRRGGAKRKSVQQRAREQEGEVLDQLTIPRERR